eukprot:TRINITY_DN8128_c0_g1_i7.p1 TRINITY_DN8128_c0_g1~~TRINITY_DN8128_c0_g1_i7.p1  ORF type:complete len:341 (-),score=103.91 TRINITY_DN8128_c0_g1_i7:110-1132(-)
MCIRDRYMGKAVSKETLHENLKQILLPLFEWDEDSRNNHKAKLKHLIEKLIRKLGKDKVEQGLPQDHKKLVKYVVKQERMAKKKRAELKAEREQMMEEQQEVRNQRARKRELEQDSDQERDEEDIMRDDGRGAQEGVENDMNLLLKFDTLKEKFHFAEHPIVAVKKKEKENQLQEKKRTEDVVFNEKTRQIIVYEDEKLTGKKRRRNKEEDTEEDILADKVGKGKNMDIEGVAINEAVGHQSLTSGNKLTKLKKINEKGESKKKLVHNVKESGDIYRPKSAAGGDVVLPGRPTPYAFVQLNPKALNKRNKGKAASSFGFLMGDSKKGTLKGLKKAPSNAQ